ncbi:MAG: hypothetical protein KGJ79_05260 [Alphaproteobacteria bacterium]|nr:hypothetical protein [Alphaproteobacteria bacterium]
MTTALSRGFIVGTYVVVPHSAYGPFPHFTLVTADENLLVMLLFGLIVAFFARRHLSEMPWHPFSSDASNIGSDGLVRFGRTNGETIFGRNAFEHVAEFFGLPVQASPAQFHDELFESLRRYLLLSSLFLRLSSDL